MVGLLIGIPVLRLQGDYLAIVTLAFGEIIKGIFQLPLCRRGCPGPAHGLKLTSDKTNLAWAVRAMIIGGPMGAQGHPGIVHLSRPASFS